jgi:predicted ATP-grasp superfamily ATP-dependent carboligase
MVADKLFVFEFVAGGGFNKEDIPLSLFCEGFAMLRAAIEDFKTIGFEVETTLDERISKIREILKADNVLIVNNEDNYIDFFKKALQENAYIFIIAPEFFDILYDLTRLAEQNKKILLSVDSKFVKFASSKLGTYQFFRNHNLFPPKTVDIQSHEHGLNEVQLTNDFRSMKKPVIIKPDDGVGAELIYFINDDNDFQHFLKIIKENNEKFQNRNFLMQQYIPGRDASVSLVGTESSPIPICTNAQFMSLSGISEPTQYLGGYSPIKEIPNSHFKKLVKALGQFKTKGYFGVDILLMSANFYACIEINPRLTTSYLGIRNIFEQNLFEFIYNLKRGETEYFSEKTIGFSHFKRIDYSIDEQEPSPNPSNGREIDIILANKIPELITPPISLDGTNYSCFIATREMTMNDSENRLKEIEEYYSKNLI